MHTKYNSILEQYQPITLSELDNLALMKRVDLKFVCSTQQLPEILNRLKHEYRILEIKGSRASNYCTKYLDTSDYQLYMMHHNGRLNRQKVRYRTYLNSNDHFLEIKSKNNKGVTIKTRIKTDKTELETRDEKLFLTNSLHYCDSNLQEVLENTFCRIMLLSFKTKERISIDYNLAFYHNGKKTSLPFLCIIEVKRERSNANSPIIETLKGLSIQPRGFSKYCVGLAMLNSDIKKNTFKPNLLHLKKIEHAYHTA